MTKVVVFVGSQEVKINSRNRISAFIILGCCSRGEGLRLMENNDYMPKHSPIIQRQNVLMKIVAMSRDYLLSLSHTTIIFFRRR